MSLQLEATQSILLFASKVFLGGRHAPEKGILEACWVLWGPRSGPSSPDGLEDTAPACCASSIGHLKVNFFSPKLPWGRLGQQILAVEGKATQ